ncbi:MAG: ABC-type sugar transport system, periplasmic component [Anaerocolumna sp.]|jgi:putative aldouronate transport system substrate-binding protein|nr:ABC-type sugar transport system, periplasmic component [Anaerocolumna sp.]
MKRVLFFLLFSILFICGCNENNEYNESEKMTEVPPPITFTFYNQDGEEDMWSDPVAKKITEATGVTIETDYPVGGDVKKVKLMIASNSYPDIIFAKKYASDVIEAGALIDLTELIEQYGPNIKKIYGDSFDRLQYNSKDKSIYQLYSEPYKGENYIISGDAQLQYSVLKEHDFKRPKDLYEFEQYIKDYMKKYPQIYGKDTIGISLSCSDWHWYVTLANPSGYIANGAPDNGQWIIDDDNDYKVTYKHRVSGQKEYYAWLNRMYHEGILDPDFATQTHDDYLAKIKAGRVLGLFDEYLNYQEADRYLESIGRYDRTYAGLPLTMNESITSSAHKNQGSSFGWGIGITVACKDPVRAIQFIDYLCSDAGQVLTHWGIEGVNYFVDENGKRYLTKDEIDQLETDINYQSRTGVGKHTYPWPSYGSESRDEFGNAYTLESKERTIEGYNPSEQEAAKAWGVDLLSDIFPREDSYVKPPYNPLYSALLPTEVADITKILDDISWSGLIQCIIANPDDFDACWEKLQDDLIAAKCEKAEKLLTEYIQEQVYEESLK